MASMSAILSTLRSRESGGRYGLTPQQNYDYPRSHASGAYQFQPATWRRYSQASGLGTQYSEAYQAPPAVQDQVAAYALAHGGRSNWEPYSGKLPTLTEDDVSGSVSSGSDPDIRFDAPAPGGGNKGTQDQGYEGGDADYGGGGATKGTEDFEDYGVGGSALADGLGGVVGDAVGKATGSGSGAATGLPSIAAWGWDKIVRGFLILLGLILVAVAAWGVVQGEFNPVEHIKKALKA